MLNADWTDSQNSADGPATTKEAGSPRASSSAWLGPVSTAVSRGPRHSAMICVGRAKVPNSIPFTTLSVGTAAGTIEESVASVDLR